MDLLAVDLNWPVIIVVGIAAIALLVFIARRNVKDKEDLEQTINQGDQKPLEHDDSDESRS